MTTLDLRRIGLMAGEELRDEHEVEIAPIELGGQRYVTVPERVPAELTVTRAATGTALRLRLTAQLHGPCYRCLEDAALDQPVDAREYQAEDPQGDEELESAYVANNRLDLSAWGATRWCWPCRTRFSASPTAPGCARSAARTSTESPTATRDRRSTPDGRGSRNCETRSDDYRPSALEGPRGARHRVSDGGARPLHRERRPAVDPGRPRLLRKRPAVGGLGLRADLRRLPPARRPCRRSARASHHFHVRSRLLLRVLPPLRAGVVGRRPRRRRACSRERPRRSSRRPCSRSPR